jgi:predicted RNA-binding Zn-ribbon protein involved in translation (DUF1610 family)
MTDNHGTCPYCGSDMNGESIWQTFFDKYGDEQKADETAALYGATRTQGRWGRRIGLYSMELDRTVAWKCPDCGDEWDRTGVQP